MNIQPINAGVSTEPKKILEKAYNSIQSFNKGLQNVVMIIVYGNKTKPVELVDFRDSEKRNEIKYAIRNIGENPSLLNVVNTLEVINTYDLCNPLMFAINNLVPPGSEVANAFDSVQEEINELVDSFRKFSLVAGVIENIATPVGGSLEFKTGKIELNTRDENKFTRGSFVTITQNENPKVTSLMRGSIEEVNRNGYIINVESISPSTPPYQRNNNGDVITDDANIPVLATFNNFTIEGENQLVSDVQGIGNDLVDISNDLRGFDFISVELALKSIPNSFPGVRALKKAIKDINDEIKDIQNRNQSGASDIADQAQTAGSLLAGGFTAEEAIAKSRKLRDAYNKILPYTDLKFALQEGFKKDIENINRFLRDFIPFEELAAVVGVINKTAKTVVAIIDFAIALITTINNIIKAVVIVLKVIRVVLKVIQLVIAPIPSLLTTVGMIEKPTNFISKIQDGISRAIDLLIKISREFNKTIGLLSFGKTYLQYLIKETAELQAKLESCPGLNKTGFSESMNEASRNSFFALKRLLDTIPNLDKFEAGQQGVAEVNKTGATTFVVIDGKGTIMVLPDSVFGYDEFGNIVFYGDLTSLATGVSFEDTLGQDFRSRLNYYTFNKFEAAKHGPLIEAAENIYSDSQIVADSGDAFGNFQEIYLGYTLKIQEDKPVDKNKQNLLRRRGIALDSENNIVAATSLTFSDDLPGIINELKYKLKIRVNEGIIGINTSDKQPNQISDSDALDLAENLGSNPLALSNIKAQSNNRATSNISSGNASNSIEGKSINPNDPTETRIGGGAFTKDETMGEGNIMGASSVGDKESPSRIINTRALLNPILEEQRTNNPEVKAISDMLNTLSSVDSTTLNNLLKSPGSQDLSDTELFNTLKEQILSTVDPNPNKVEEVKRKTAQWYEGLRNSTRLEWEQLTLNYRPPQRPAPPEYETYFTQVEELALPQWVRTLQRAKYTDTEIQYGISDVNIRDKYQIKIGPEPNKVEVTLRPAFRRKS
jgi:hypothetical protein